MPLAAIALELPEHCVHAVAQDTDADGRDEIVVGCRTLRQDGPDALVLTLLDFDDQGRLQDTDLIDLGTRAMLWDGRYAVDGLGLVSLTPRGRLASKTTPLASLGQTTPIWAPLRVELNGAPLLLLWAGGQYHLYTESGDLLASVKAPSTGDLEARDRAGGFGVDQTLRAPPLAIGDVDGDGSEDLILPVGDQATVWFSRGGGLAVEQAVLKLPKRIEARDGDDERWVTAAAWEDLDGDGRVDLLLSEMAGDGSFFGSTAELSWYRGTGGGFELAQTLTTGTGSWEVVLRDVDSDGDLDLVIPQVDIGVSSLARGLVSKRIPVQLSLYRNETGRFDGGAVLLQTFVDLDDPNTAWTVDADLDGDGRAELVFIEGQSLHVRRLEGVELGVLDARGATELITADVDGDGVREVVAWGEGGALLVWYE